MWVKTICTRGPFMFFAGITAFALVSTARWDGFPGMWQLSDGSESVPMLATSGGPFCRPCSDRYAPRHPFSPPLLPSPTGHAEPAGGAGAQVGHHLRNAVAGRGGPPQGGIRGGGGDATAGAAHRDGGPAGEHAGGVAEQPGGARVSPAPTPLLAHHVAQHQSARRRADTTHHECSRPANSGAQRNETGKVGALLRMRTCTCTRKDSHSSSCRAPIKTSREPSAANALWDGHMLLFLAPATRGNSIRFWKGITTPAQTSRLCVNLDMLQTKP